MNSLQISSIRPKTKGVILITDNRPKIQKSLLPDFRQSAFKETQIDPLQVWAEINAQHQEDSMIEELNRRILQLEQRVKKLQKSDEFSLKISQNDKEKDRYKKLRRKFSQIQRKYTCQFEYCQKIYGSLTSLKHHLLIKHNVIYMNNEGEQDEEQIIEQQSQKQNQNVIKFQKDEQKNSNINGKKKRKQKRQIEP